MPKELVPFDKSISGNDYNKWVHFYIHDTFFERVWNNPRNYLNILRKYQGVFSPDFSIYRDMPLAMQIWNTYRNRAIGYWLEKNNIKVIPNVRWGDERTFRFCFDGIRKNSIISVGAYGNIKHKSDRGYFLDGFIKMKENIKPKKVIVYGSLFEELEKYLKETELSYCIFPCDTFKYKKKATA